MASTLVSHKFLVIRMMKAGIFNGMDFEDSQPPTTLCLGCSLGKAHRLPLTSARTKATELGELIHADVCGPMQEETPSGSKYYVAFKDDYSGYRAIYFLKLKSEVFEKFKLFVCKIRNEIKVLVRTLRSDGGGEFTSSEFENWLTSKNIRDETSPAHTPQLNSVSERDHRTIGEAERSCTYMQNVPLNLWAESYNCATYTLNRTPTDSHVTPYELWFKKKPHLGPLRIFGCTAYIHIPNCDRKKLDVKSTRCMFIGYYDTTKAYRLWDPATRRIKISRDVSFDELSLASSSDNPDMKHSIPQPKHCWAEAASLHSTILFDDQKEPESYSRAISDINAESWKKAMS
jgi:hypothetical protein